MFQLDPAWTLVVVHGHADVEFDPVDVNVDLAVVVQWADF